METVEMAGKRYGRLRVLERAGSDAKGKALWRCVCDCGREAVLAGVKLRKGVTKSCGCLRREQLRNKRGYFVCYKGRWYTLNQLSKATGIGVTTLAQRYQAGLRGADLLKSRKANQEEWRGREVYRVEYQGQLMTLSELSRETGISAQTLRWRYRKGLRGTMLVHGAKECCDAVESEERCVWQR